MPEDPQNPDSLGDDRTFTGEREAPAQEQQSLGDADTHAGGMDSSISDLELDGQAVDSNLPLIDLATRYKIEEELGRGGMGAVLLATDRQLKRKVAIKRILASSQSALNRFVTEAQSIAALSHFNIVQIYEFGRDSDGPLLVLEYVSGGSLLDRLKEGKLEVEDAIGITCQLCDALAMAHQKGIIHRDIKPANILLTEEGVPKLTDFGLARQDNVDHGQTQAGAVLGTIDFMPPEQRRDATSVDARSDLWSLAATLYQMITGSSPKVIRLDQLPANLAPVIGTMLEENPDNRYATAEQFKTELRKGMATAAATVAVDLAAGVCPACNTPNDASRKFCRGCRESLIEPCLSCESGNPVWEDVCGECGSSQHEERTRHTEELTTRLEDSLTLARGHEYEKALVQLTAIQQEEHAFTKQIREDAARHGELITAKQTEQLQLRDQIVELANEHLSKNDYATVIRGLEKIPVPLRTPEITSQLSKVQSIQSELSVLLTEITADVKNRRIDGLLKKTSRLLELSPENSQIRTLHAQLLKRQQAAAGKTAGLLRHAEEQYGQFQDQAVLATLANWPRDLPLSTRAQQLQTMATDRLARVQQLKAGIALETRAEAKLPLVEEYLQLRPGDKQAEQLAGVLRRQKSEEAKAIPVYKPIYVTKKMVIAGSAVVAALLLIVIGWSVFYRPAEKTIDTSDGMVMGRDAMEPERAEVGRAEREKIRDNQERLVPPVPPDRAKNRVKIGILHSITGTMAIFEISLRDAVELAVEEINAAGGVLGKQIETVAVDPASDWDMFAEKARDLIQTEEVAVTFGCWTSVSRKSVLPVFEEFNALLFYPVQYEGEEQSLNVFYTGPTPNQQLIPAAEYMRSEDGGSCKKFYLLGTDYVFPRTANKVLKAYLKSEGVPDENIIEEYTPFHHQNYQTIVGNIKEFATSGDACVLSTINGDSNVPFYKEFANQGLSSTDCPIMAFSVAEDELRAMDVPPLVGHLACWNYYQSIDTPENNKFVQAFKDKFGEDRVTDDPIEAAYFGVYVWAAAVEKAGSFAVDDVREAVYGLEFDAPGGKKQMHASNQHTLKPVYIGEILGDGQFRIVYSSAGLISPDSYSAYLWPDGNFPPPTGGPRK